MTGSTTATAAKQLFAVRRVDGWYVPGVAVLTSILTIGMLLSVLPGSTVTSWTLTGDAGPIAQAGGLAQPVVGSFQFGVVRIYIPLLSVLLVVVGEIAAILFGRFRVLAPLVAGIGAGSQPIVVSGCGCGFGTAGSAMSLIEHVAGMGLL